MFNINDFDSISYLQIDTSRIKSQIEFLQLEKELNEKIGEYLVYKLADSLTNEQLEQMMAQAPDKMLAVFKNYIPNFEERISQELENFKKEYGNQI